MRLIHKGLILVGVPLILAIIFAGTMFALILRTDNERLEEARHRQLADHACHTLLLFEDAMILMGHRLAEGAPGRWPVTAADQYAQGPQLDVRFKDFKGRIKSDFVELQAIKQEDAAAAGAESRAFQIQVDSLIDSAKALVQVFRQRRPSFEFLSDIDEARRRITQRTYVVAKQTQAMNEASLRFQQASSKHQETLFRWQIAVLILLSATSVAFGLILARWFARDITGRLRTITDNTMRLGRGDMLLPPISGADEIAGLDRGFHAMADTLRAAMAKEKALFETASDIMCILDANFCFTAVNPACTRILGWTQEELLGLSIADFAWSQDVTALQASLLASRSQQTAQTFETRLKHQNGTEKSLLFSVYWSEYDQALYAVAHDITERKQLEQLKQDFLAMVSHDLRSPLSAVFATFRLLEAGVFGKLPAAADEKIRSVSTSVNRLVSLVNDLLDVEKLEAGKLELLRDKANVDSLLQQAVSEVQAVADQKELNIAVECSCAEFNLDAARIVQVLVNLLGNAIKFSPTGGMIKISVSGDDKALRFSIVDQGPGVPDEKKTVIFERFKQARAADATTGTGLGLPICKLIVEEHGGTIGVDNTAGGGSTFWFTVPEERRLPDHTSGPTPAATEERRLPACGLSSAATMPTATVTRPTLFERLRLWQKGLLLVAVPVVIELIFAGALYPMLDKSFQEKKEELHRRIIVSTANDILLDYFLAGFAMSLRPWSVSWAAFDEHSTKAQDSEMHLIELMADEPQFADDLARLTPLLTRLNDLIDIAHQRVQTFGVTEIGLNAAYEGRVKLQQLAEQGPELFDTLVKRVIPKDNESPARLAQLHRQQEMLLLVGIGASLLISALCAFLFSQGIARRLQSAEANVVHLQRDEVLNPPLPGDDEIAHLDTFIHHMASALDAARHKDRAVFENAQDAICSVSSDGTLLRINQACETQWGYTKAQLQGASLWQLTAEGFTANSRDLFQQAAADAQPQQLESKIRTKNGELRDVLWSLSWSQEEQAIIAIAHDITQRKELERLKQEFLAMVSHDLRTPLSSVLTVTEMIKSGMFGSITDGAAEVLGTVDRSCNRLISLINDLLDMEKLEAGQMQLNLQSTAAPDIVERTIESLSSLAESKSVKLTRQVPEKLEVWGDADRLVQVGVNLLSNAIKFSESGSEIILSASRFGDFAEFKVSDSGRGIPETHLNAIFERYRQVRVSDGKHRAGTGLGLPICKQIVEQHGGSIGVTSEVGRGSTFYFRIPCRPAKQPTSSSIQSDSRKP